MMPTTKIDDHASDAGRTDELQQVGVLPWRIRRDGEPKVMLITSRRRGRWIVPKGWPMKGRSLLVAASREAFEEAGIFGEIDPAPVTEYRYLKALGNGSEVPCRVTVFGMNVRGTLSHWREKAQRQRRWFSLGAAADKLDDAELAAFVKTLDAAPERLRPSDGLGGLERPSSEPQNGGR
ncbi:NUDIX hydrolase [Ensifer sp. Root31]|uniref:NUDIX hydrolase n=1 Tax=Ensifer sp. Root31 TaxID=1736512 RepID=UPI0009E87DE8|nr:NUDIX hydrolase [Ensifer sp. Root31]